MPGLATIANRRNAGDQQRAFNLEFENYLIARRLHPLVWRRGVLSRPPTFIPLNSAQLLEIASP